MQSEIFLEFNTAIEEGTFKKVAIIKSKIAAVTEETQKLSFISLDNKGGFMVQMPYDQILDLIDPRRIIFNGAI